MSDLVERLRTYERADPEWLGMADRRCMIGLIRKAADALAAEADLRRQAQHERDGMLGMRQEVLHYQKEFHRIKDERDALRELMNCYNLGGWTDAERLMKERDQWKARAEELKLDVAHYQRAVKRACEIFERDVQTQDVDSTTSNRVGLYLATYSAAIDEAMKEPTHG